jgi:glycerol-3-phosphate dehydrogenase
LSAANEFDLVVVGGGINGAGIARDAAGRGLSVLLVERDDLASHTSSWSSKLIHGGLRYLEYYEFRLVREALIEREVLLHAAPHIIWPLTFVLPHSPEQRPAWLVRLGLFLYDHLGGRKVLPGSSGVDLAALGPYGDPLQDWVTRGFTYSDCWVMDSRLVVLNAMDAVERGAAVSTRTECKRARREGDRWVVDLEDTVTGEQRRVTARGLVNAAGPWVSSFLKDGLGQDTAKKRVRLIKGSHIVVPKLHDGAHPYILQNTDKRIVFVIPYEDAYSLIGTTDVEYTGDPRAVAITPEETEYLLSVVNRYFERRVSVADIVWTYAGVRPLFDDASGNASAVTRDYVFDVDTGPGEGAGKAPLLSIFGGKITTYRKLAEHAMERLAPLLDCREDAWTATAVLPGGDLPGADFDRFLQAFEADYPWLPGPLARRLARAYGSRAKVIVQGRQGLNDLGQNLGGDLFEAELDYLVAHEWAMTAEDVLWRRSKLGLHLDAAARSRVEEWFREHLTKRDAA